MVNQDGERCNQSNKAAERFGHQLPRARWRKSLKTQRSRARSGQLHARVRRQLPFAAFYRDEAAIQIDYAFTRCATSRKFGASA